MSFYFAIPALGAAAPLLVLPALTSRYGSEAWASVAIAQSIGAAFAIIGELGWGVVGPQRVAGAPNKQGQELIYRSALVTKAMSLALLSPLAGASAFMLSTDFRIESAILAAGISLGALSPSWYFIGQGKPLHVLFSDSLPRLLLNILSAIALAVGAPVIVYVLVMLGLPIVTQIISLSIIGRGALIHIADTKSAPAILRGQLIMAGGRTVSVLYTSLPIAMVAMVAPSAVPLYSASERLMRMALTVLSGVPSRLQSWIGSSNGDEKVKRNRDSIVYNSLVGVVCGLGFTFLAPLASRFIFSGEVNIPFSVSVFSGILLCTICISRGLGLSLVSFGGANLITIAIVAAALSGSLTIIPLTLVLGVIGPIIGETIAEVMGLLMQVGLLSRLRKRLMAQRFFSPDANK